MELMTPILQKTIPPMPNQHSEPDSRCVAISNEEYANLIRAAAQLDNIIIQILSEGYIPRSVILSYAQERNINMEVDYGNRETVLLDKAQGGLR